MTNLKIIRINLIIIAVIGLLICGIWYPFSISLGSWINGITNTPSYIQLIFYWGCSIPCFVILFLLYKVTLTKGNILNSFITNLNTSKKILTISLIIFLIGNIFFMVLNQNDFAVLYFIITLLGVAVVSIFNILINSIKYVVSLEEEVGLYL